MAEDKVEFKLTGADELVATIGKLSKDTNYKGARFAGRKAANIVRETAVGHAQRIDRESTRHAIYKNITVKFSPRRFQQFGDIAFRVGILGGAKTARENEQNPGGDTFYWRFQEYGTVNHPPVKHWGDEGFMRPALLRNAQKVLDEFTGQYQRWLDRWIRREAKKAQGGK